MKRLIYMLGSTQFLIWINIPSIYSAAALFKLQRREFSTIVGFTTGHCIMDTQSKHVDLEWMISIEVDKKEDETVFYLLFTCPALCQRRKSQLGAYCMEYLNKLLCGKVMATHMYARKNAQQRPLHLSIVQDGFCLTRFRYYALL